MNRISLFIVCCLMANMVNFSNANNINSDYTDFLFSGYSGSSLEKAPGNISATISGTTSTCLNATTSPKITFTGTGGTSPYKFSYKIGTGPVVFVSSGTGSDIATVDVNTNASGLFTYTLTNVSDATLASQAISNQAATVTVNDPPVSDFSFPDNQCSGTEVQFTPALSGNYTYTWNFGDGSTSSDPNPRHTFTSLGCGSKSYQVTLTVIDLNGCQSSKTKTLNINQTPDIDFVDVNNSFDPFSNCSNASASTPDYTIKVGNNSASISCITSYSIVWGDGTTASNVTFPVSHTYSELGAFNMVITAVGTNGCSNSKQYIVKNVTNPSGGIISPGTTTDLCAPTAPLQFEIARWGANSPGTIYTVDYGDNSPAVRLTQEQLIASPYFLASDPSKSANYPIPHSYTTSNCPKSEFVATLTVTSACRSTNFTANSITILTKPEADFTIPVSGCINSGVVVTNTTVPGYSQNCNKNATYTWDFGDGTPSVVVPLSLPQNITHTYASTGNYTIKLTAENYCGSTSKSRQISINSLPTATISGGSTICQNAPSPDITFTGANGTAPYTFTYTLNNIVKTATTTSGNSITISAPTGVSGTFTYKLESVQEGSPSACSQAQTGTVVVDVIPLPTATISGTAGACLNSSAPVTFTGSNGTAPYTFTYNINGGNDQLITTNSGNSISIPAPTTTVGTFTFNLTSVKDAGVSNCSKPLALSATITVNPTPTVNDITSQTKCTGDMSDAILFTGAVSGTVYTWTNTNPSIGIAASGTGNINPFLLKNTGTTVQTATFVVTPTFTSAGNTCTGNTTSFTITVNPTPTITTEPKPSVVCLGGVADPLTIVFNGVGTPSYKWYRNTLNNNSTGSEIANETNSTYIPPTNIADTLYYYCEISFTDGACSNLKTNATRVIVNPVPAIKDQPEPSQTICIGGTSPNQLKVTYTGGAGIASCQWYSSLSNSTSGGAVINGATDLNYTPPAFTSVGTYYYYAEIKFTGSGCNLITSDTARITVLNLPAVTSQPMVTQTVCQNAVPSDLTVTATGGIGTFKYQWYSNTTKNNSTGTLIATATTNTYTPSTTGAGTTWYYCIISQPNGAGCTVTSDFSEVIVKANPSFTKQPLSTSVCVGTTPAALFVEYINGTGTPQYQWYSNFTNSLSGATPVPLATNSTFIPPAANVGTMYYYCIVTFSSTGCSTITSSVAQVTVNAYPVVSDISYELNSGYGLNFTPGTTPGDIIPAGTTFNWTLPQITPPNSISGATAQPAGGNVFDQALDNTSTGVATATYTVTPVSGQCTGNPFLVVVKVNPPINPGINITNSTCFDAGNGSISTNISGGVSFKTGNPYLVSWTGPNGFSSTATMISSLKPGNYILDITDSVGYNFTRSYSVSEPDDLIINSTPVNVSCNGAADGKIGLLVNGGTLPYSYTWKKDDVPFPGSDVIRDLSPGKYTVVVTDANSCVPKMDTILISEPTPIVIALNKQANLTCFGDKSGGLSVDISGGVPFENTPGVFTYTCLWTGPNGYSASTEDLSALAAGTYHLTVTDKAGCTQYFTDSVIQPKPVNIRTVVTPVTCYGKKDASILLDITGGVPPYKIAWNNLSNGTYLTNLAPGTYSVQVTDSANCQKSASVTIAETDFNIKPVVKQITCFGANDGSIILNIQGGIAPVTLKWDDDPAAGNIRYGLKPGTYTVTVHDQASCDIVQPFMIIEPTELNISAVTNDALDCNNQNSGAISLTPTGGVPPYKYSWSNGRTTKDLSAIPAGQYMVTVTDANGCTATGKFDILRPAPIKLSVTTTPDFNCLTLVSKVISTARITGGSSPYTFNWSGGTVSGTSNETMEATLPGIYTLGVTDGNGCTAKLSFNVTLAYPGIDYQVTDCDKHILNFNAVIPYGVESDFTYSWDFGDGKKATTRNPEHTYATPGDYNVILILTSPTCNSTFTKTITVDAPPVLLLDKLPVFCTGDSILLHVSGADTYRWSDGSKGNSMWLKRTGDYFVTGTAKSGCTAQLQFTGSNFESFNYTIQSDHNDVTAKAPTLQLWSESISYSDYFWDFGDLHTAKGNIQDHTYNITQDGYYDIKLKVVNPNGCLEYATKRIWITDASKVNVLTPNGDGTNDVFLRGFHIQVYNRNGFLLYDGTDGWDGKYKGKLVLSDTYFYVIYLEGQSGVKTQTGFVTVIL